MCRLEMALLTLYRVSIMLSTISAVFVSLEVIALFLTLSMINLLQFLVSGGDQDVLHAHSCVCVSLSLIHSLLLVTVSKMKRRALSRRFIRSFEKSTHVPAYVCHASFARLRNDPRHKK